MTVVTSQSELLTLTLSETRGERVRLDEVTKTYVTDGQPVHALNGVSHSVRQGEFVALLGVADAASPRCSISLAPWTFRRLVGSSSTACPPAIWMRMDRHGFAGFDAFRRLQAPL